jgi:hypothetical protein
MEREDALSIVLRSVRLSGSVQFCFMPTGEWRIDAPQSLGMDQRMLRVVPFHIELRRICRRRFCLSHAARGSSFILA